MKIKVNTNGAAAIALRSEPDHEAKMIGTLANGTELTADTLTGSWLHVTTPSGQQGYIAAAFVEGGVDGIWDTIKNKVSSLWNKATTAVSTATLPTGNFSKTQYVTGNGVRIRSSTDTSNLDNVLTKLNIGTAVSVDPSQAKDNWAYVQTTDGKVKGYMAQAYLSDNKPKTTATTTTTITAEDSTAAQTDNKMTMSENVRKYLKWGLIALATCGIGYGIYKVAKGGDTASAPRKKSAAKALNGVGGEKSGKRKKKKSDAIKPVKF